MATTQSIINYYANLLIMQYIGKPKAYAHIQLLAQLATVDQLPALIRDGFNIDPNLGPTAVGAQLDIIGKYVGASRNGYNFTGPITLNDSDFLLLIKLAIAQNTSQATLADIQNFILQYFSGAFIVFDFGGMRMGYYLESDVGSQNLVQLFVKQGRLPKPMGVTLSSLIYAPAAKLKSFFGFSTTALPTVINYNRTGFNHTASYTTSSPWLSTANAISQ